MFCIECGEDIAEDSTFCPECGIPIIDEEQEFEQVQGAQYTSVLMRNEERTQHSGVEGTQDQAFFENHANFYETNQSYASEYEEDINLSPPSPRKGKMIIISISTVLAAVVIGIGAFYIWKKINESPPSPNARKNLETEQESELTDDEDLYADDSDASVELESSTTVVVSKQENVDIKYHQIDISQYPKIRVYYQMQSKDGSVIGNINSQDFALVERVGGESVDREVLLAGSVETHGNVAVDLVIDSGSGINESQLGTIKNALSLFTDKLQSKNNNRAEILQTNTAVYEAVGFTSDISMLKDGIDQLQIYGGMAVYDALLAAINRTALQSGSKYVVALTCGLDSGSTVANIDSVINTANLYQIPVYVIGFGDYLDESGLREIADKTGGTYQHISDLNNLSSIYNEIYDMQTNLYMLEFTTDSTIEQLTGREITLTFQQEKIDGILVQNVMPQGTSTNNGGVSVKDLKTVDMSANAAATTAPTTNITPTTTSPSPDIAQLIENAVVSYANAFVDGVNATDFSYVSWTLIPDSPIYKDQKRYIENSEGITEKLLYCGITELKKIDSETYSVSTIEDYEITNPKNGFFTASFKTNYTVKLYQGEWKMYSLDTLERL